MGIDVTLLEWWSSGVGSEQAEHEGDHDDQQQGTTDRYEGGEQIAEEAIGVHGD